MASSLSQDYAFADYSMADYDERSGVIQQATRSTVWFVKNLFFYTKGRLILRAGWIFEFICNVALLVVAFTEMRSSCLIEFGVEMMCYTCYGLPFLTWIFFFHLVWLLNTYMHVLLISRGFAFSRNVGKVLEENRMKGIPGIAVIVFMFLIFLMFSMVVGGVVLVVHSNSCPTADHIAGVRTLKRSETLFWACIIAMVTASITLPFIRFSEVIFAKKEPKHQDAENEGEFQDEQKQKYGTFHKYMDRAKEKQRKYLDKYGDVKQGYMEKFHEKRDVYMDKYHEKRDHLVEKKNALVEKVHDKERMYVDKFRNHGQYLDKYQPQDRGPIPTQSL